MLSSVTCICACTLECITHTHIHVQNHACDHLPSMYAIHRSCGSLKWPFLAKWLCNYINQAFTEHPAWARLGTAEVNTGGWCGFPLMLLAAMFMKFRREVGYVSIVTFHDGPCFRQERNKTKAQGHNEGRQGGRLVAFLAAEEHMSKPGPMAFSWSWHVVVRLQSLDWADHEGLRRSHRRLIS